MFANGDTAEVWKHSIFFLNFSSEITLPLEQAPAVIIPFPHPFPWDILCEIISYFQEPLHNYISSLRAMCTISLVNKDCHRHLLPSLWRKVRLTYGIRSASVKYGSGGRGHFARLLIARYAQYVRRLDVRCDSTDDLHLDF